MGKEQQETQLSTKITKKTKDRRVNTNPIKDVV